MISMAMSSVQHNTAKSAELAAAMEQFLARGGSVCNLQGFVHKPKPPASAYGRKFAPAPAATPAPATTTKQHVWNEGVRVNQVMKDNAKQLAMTKTLTQVQVATGLSSYVLKRIAKEGEFEFQKWNPSGNLITRHTDPVLDAFNVVRIKDARDRGLSKKAAIQDLDISNTLMKRLIREFAIDYPLQHAHK